MAVVPPFGSFAKDLTIAKALLSGRDHRQPTPRLPSVCCAPLSIAWRDFGSPGSAVNGGFEPEQQRRWVDDVTSGMVLILKT
jgi:hypothetical protein